MMSALCITGTRTTGDKYLTPLLQTAYTPRRLGWVRFTKTKHYIPPFLEIMLNLETVLSQTAESAADIIQNVNIDVVLVDERTKLLS